MKRLVSLLVCIVLSLSVVATLGFNVSAYDNVFDTPTELKDGYTKTYNDVYEYPAWGSIKIVAPKDGNISISYTTSFGYTKFTLIDEYGANIAISQLEIKSGDKTSLDNPIGQTSVEVTPNFDTMVGNGSVGWNVKKGTYFLVWNKTFNGLGNGNSLTLRCKITSNSDRPSPKINKISTGNKKAWIYWNSINGATSYRVYVIQNNKELLAGSTTKTKFLVTNMSNGVKANYYVKAVVNGKLSTEKNIAYSTPRNGIKPSISLTSGKAAIKWTKYAGATQYKVVQVDKNNKILAERVTKGTAFDWMGLQKGREYGFYIVPFVNGDYIPFGRSYAEDRANIVHITAK